MELRIPVDSGYLWADDSGGGGPALVLLHPGWGDSSIWQPVLELLPRRQARPGRREGRGDGLLDGLDPVDTALAAETLRRLAP